MEKEMVLWSGDVQSESDSFRVQSPPSVPFSWTKPSTQCNHSLIIKTKMVPRIVNFDSTKDMHKLKS
jgi:hypothetical protein